MTQRDTGMETCLFSSRCLSWSENSYDVYFYDFEEFTLCDMTNVVHNNTISEPNQSQDGHRLGNI